MAIAGAALLVLMSAVSRCGFDGCGDAGDDPASAIVFLLAGAFCLVSPVLFVPWTQSRRARVIGAAATLGIVAVGAAVAVGAPRAGSWATVDDGVPSEEEQYQLFERENAEAWVTDNPGTRIGYVSGSWTAVVTAGGGVIEIERVDAEPPTPCAYLADTYLVAEPQYHVDDEALWCERDGERWARADGTGVVGFEGGSYTLVRSGVGFSLEHAGGDRPGSTEEVAETYASLRPIYETELRAAFENQRVPQQG
ncbi:hypothetical protein [Demequina aestuarii]|uniref:hypothetical protein n=1 Tax=Demequina aestuarii TaxID=327095 RepID=UPI00128E645F|nr:hypothetical protein [Demequina aestuarii]